MKRGDRGEAVKALQQAVNRYLALDEDGFFGALTEARVREVQTTAKLPVTGVADDATLRTLGITPTPPAPPKPAAIIPSSATLIGDLGFTGGLDKWAVLQTKDRNASPGSYSTWRASVRDGGPGHPTAARFEVRTGDVPNFGGGERSEVQASPRFDVRHGDETWYSWSTRLGDPGGGFPNASGWGLIIMQWHSREGSPPLSIHAEGGQVSLQNDRPGGYARNVCPVDPGNWHDYVLHVKWSHDADGLIEMWHDAKPLISYRAANCVGGEANYLKAGIYRANQSGTHVVWHDGLKVFRA